MRGRVLVWAGAGIAVAALAGLGVYLSRVKLDEADKLASVIGLFVAVAGLGVAVYGVVAGRKDSGGGTAEPDRPGVSASGERPVDGGGIVSTGDGARNIQMRAEASGSGRVYQAGGDQTVNE
ncbi:hypothetical protein AB0K21_40090 [Streptosporangium sp. NPDC049248]|uniref:hypothetical protein n=1 Tax=Streptosporangium sp. NPDC049248 TaxID=3155651 RepID=UPI00341AA9BB